MEPRIEYTLDC